MLDLAFLTLATAYVWFGAKVDEWITISTLGFGLEVPQGFLDRPRRYDFIRVVLLALAAACLLGTTRVPWFVGLGVLAVAWFSTTWLGQRRAFATYRRICREGIEDAEN